MIRQGLAAAGVGAALLVLLAPLPFGGVTPWASALCHGASFLLLAIVLLSADRWAAVRRVIWPVAMLLAVALLGVFQSLPWPESWISALSPGHARLFAQAGELAGTEGGAALSIAPEVSRSTAIGWAAAAACLALGALLGQERRRRRLLLGALTVAGLVQVAIGLSDWVADRTTLWGVEVASAPGRLHGTFVNPNHCAAYLGLLLPCVVAGGWWAVGRALGEERTESRLLWLVPPALLWLLYLGGIGFTSSRGALVAAAAGLGVQVVLLARYYRRWWLVGAGTVGGAAALAVGVWLGLVRGLDRLVATNPFDVSMGSRWAAYEATLDLWRRFPVFGSGLGTFRDGFPLVQPTVLTREWWHAHNDYLELLATAGVVGAVLVLIGVVMLVRTLLAGLRSGERSEDRALCLAALGALAATGAHEALDFGLTMPAISLTLALLCGLAAGASRREASGRRHRAGPRSVPRLRSPNGALRG